MGNVCTWKWQSGGQYSAKSYQHLIKSGGRTNWPFQEIWITKIPPTVKVFLYLLLQDKLLTKQVLQRRNIYCTGNCVTCNHCTLETAFHLIFNCQYAVRAWARMATLLGCSLLRVIDDVEVTWTKSMLLIRSKGDHDYKLIMVCFMSLCWHLWLHRNNCIFRGVSVPPEITAERAVNVGFLWRRYC